MSPLKTIAVAAVLGAALFAAGAALAPKSVKTSLAFTVTQQARQATADYAYDGYYAIRAAELASDTLMSWLSTPSVIREIHAAADIELSDAEALKGRVFRAKKLSAQNVVMTFPADDEEAARRLSAAAFASLSARIDELARSADGESLFVLAAAEPVVARASVAPKAAAVSGFLVGAFAGFLFAYVVRGRSHVAKASRDEKDPQP